MHFVTGLQPIAPKFKMNNPQYLTLDEPGWIYCRVASDPSVKFFWSKQNPWPFGDRLNDLEFVPLLNGSLFVRRAKKTYEGDFYCTAVNSGGHKSSAINVKVKGEVGVVEIRFNAISIDKFSNSCPRSFASRPAVHVLKKSSALGIILRYTSRRKGFIYLTSP